MMLELFVKQQQTRLDFIARQGPQRQVVEYKSLFSEHFSLWLIAIVLLRIFWENC